MSRIRRDPGVLCSRLDPQYQNLYKGMKKGMYTGMLPGFTLSFLTDTGHPEAVDSFNTFVRRSIDGSGNLLEDMILDDYSGLALIYDSRGKLGEYTAKFRPWEGGIVLDAAYKYLVGFSPDANKKIVSLRPHIPNNWPSMAANGLRAGDDRFDLAVKHTSVPEYEIHFASKGQKSWAVDLRWDSGTKIASISVNGKAVPEKELTRYTHFGTNSVGISGVQLEAGKTAIFKISEK
jgi:hypothetical protein